MRGTVAKRLRARVLDQVPTAVLLSLSDEPRYVPKPGTGRIKKIPVGFELNPDGTQKVDEFDIPILKYVELKTVTFTLAPDCRRYYTQRYKRGYVRERSLAA
jgi:hypothetical protein